MAACGKPYDAQLDEPVPDAGADAAPEDDAADTSLDARTVSAAADAADAADASVDADAGA